MSKLQLTIKTSAPTLATDGNDLRTGAQAGGSSPNYFQGFKDGELNNLVLFYYATASSAPSCAFLRLWIYDGNFTNTWFPVGPAATSTDTDRGKLNITGGAVVALGAITTNKIQFTQVVSLLGGPTRVCLETNTTAGTGYSDQAWLVCGRDNIPFVR
jgi:hypothetical protein